VTQRVCTTIHDKSAARAHIESLGYDILANFGDRFSDLEGGRAEHFQDAEPNDFLPLAAFSRRRVGR
jgi:hypothetical protein